MASAAASFISLVTREARTSSMPRKNPGKQSTRLDGYLGAHLDFSAKMQQKRAVRNAHDFDVGKCSHGFYNPVSMGDVFRVYGDVPDNVFSQNRVMYQAVCNG